MLFLELSKGITMTYKLRDLHHLHQWSKDWYCEPSVPTHLGPGTGAPNTSQRTIQYLEELCAKSISGSKRVLYLMTVPHPAERCIMASSECECRRFANPWNSHMRATHSMADNYTSDKWASARQIYNKMCATSEDSDQLVHRAVW